MNVFVYGTLLVPSIWNAVTQFPNLESQSAELMGFRIFRVRNADYPGIVASSPDMIVPGKIYLDVPRLGVERLDAYEDTFYERRPVKVTVPCQGETTAQAYCIPAATAPAILSCDPWTLAWFEDNALERFQRRVFGI